MRRICSLGLAFAKLQLVIFLLSASFCLADEPQLGAPEVPSTKLRGTFPQSPTPTPTPTPTATPTPTPTPTPNSQQCAYYRVDEIYHHNGDGYQHGNSMFRGTKGSLVKSLYGLQCIQDIFRECSIPEGSAPKMIGYERLRDDCVFLKLTEIAGLNCGHFDSRQMNCIKVDDGTGTGIRCKHTADPVYPWCRERVISVLFNAACKLVKPGVGDKICGAYNAISLFSPISLLWTPDAEIESVFQAVEFRLNPYEASHWQSWRASEKTPLLVYDPEHKGEIRDGSQLFGTWTFGGRSYASLENLVDGRAKSAWDNGYQALAELDANHNNRIDGNELKPLGLWFDKNQDGISQPGEVLSAEQVGLTALYFEAEKYDVRTRTMRASLGFERLENGKSITGQSVDWFGETANSKLEMLSKEQARVVKEFSAQPENPADVAALVPTTGAEKNARFTGPWIWQLEGENPLGDKAVSGGILFLTVDENKPGIGGSSYVELPVRDRNGFDFRSLSRLQVEGVVEEDGKSLKFRLLNNGKVVTQSTAVISEDGMTLSGESRASLVKEEGSKELSVISYKWVARRY